MGPQPAIEIQIDAATRHRTPEFMQTSKPEPTPQDVIDAARGVVTAPALRAQARKHYQIGNRFFDFRALDRAADEWRKAAWMWRLADIVRPRRRERLTDLRAVILLLLTVLLLFNLVYGFFPRNPADLAMEPEDESQDTGTNWWERWLDTGHPQSGGGQAITLREWWQRLESRWRSGSEEAIPEAPVRQDLDDRWPELVSKYRRPGFTEPLDYHLVAGYGYLRTGEYKEAADAFAHGIATAKRSKQRADLYQGLANAYYYQGYKTDPDGLATYNLQLVRNAAEAYENSVAAEPRALSLGNLGWMYFLLGEYAQAESNSQRALRMEKNLHYVRLNLGLIYLVQAKNDNAYDAYRQVIRAQPEEDVLTGGINDLREIARDRPGQYPFGDLMTGLLARAKGDTALAERSLRRFLKSQSASDRWRRLAEQALANLSSPVGGL